MEQPDRNGGTLWPNRRKTQPKHPDWTGRIEIDGRPYRVAAWDRSGRTGARLLSLSITPDTEKEHG